MKGRIAVEFEQSSLLKWYDYKVTVIRSHGRHAVVKKRKRVDEALLEETTVEVFPDAGPVYSADAKHEGSPHASTVSKAHAACEGHAACEDEHEDAEPAAYKDEPCEDKHEDARSEPAAFKGEPCEDEHEDAMSEPAAFKDEPCEDEHEDARFEPAACNDEHEEDSCPKLDPKHKVFLSHSGDEKPFVGKLCKLLEACNHFPFFDQRQDSLPKGKKFARLIIEAAQKCQGMMDGWILRSGLKLNGLVAHKYMNNGLYRDAIVEAIFKLAPPDLLYDMSKIHGGDRVCKMLTNKFERHPQTTASVLGMYGMGGLGKTTISKCLCNHFNQEFSGRVCYIEMEDGKDALMR